MSSSYLPGATSIEIPLRDTDEVCSAVFSVVTLLNKYKTRTFYGRRIVSETDQAMFSVLHPYLYFVLYCDINAITHSVVSAWGAQIILDQEASQEAKEMCP